MVLTPRAMLQTKHKEEDQLIPKIGASRQPNKLTVIWYHSQSYNQTHLGVWFQSVSLRPGPALHPGSPPPEQPIMPLTYRLMHCTVDFGWFRMIQ